MIAVLTVSALTACSSNADNNIDKQYSSLESDTQSKQSSESLAALPVSENSSEQVNSEDTILSAAEIELRNAMQAKLTPTEQLYQFKPARYGDSDGAFAVVGTGYEDSDNTITCNGLLYADQNGVQRIESPFGSLSNKSSVIEVDGGKTKLICYYGGYATERPVALYTIRDGKPHYLKLYSDGITQNFQDDIGNEFTLIQNTLDMSVVGGISCGRTIKPYWAYWNSERGEFVEYGAVAITAKELALLDKENILTTAITTQGDKLISADLEPTKGTITSILKRNNGKLHINFTTGDAAADESVNNHFVTVNIVDGKVDLSTAIYGDGIYLTALNPHISNTIQ